MKGKHLLKVSDNRVVYELTIRRNITIIRGDSATGKTTLLEMMDACLRYGEESGIKIECDAPVAVYLTDNRKGDWKSQLQEYEGSIVFIEELNAFVKTKEFAEYVSGSRSYYVLITRWSLKNLPYSVDEIYKLTEKGKYPGTRKIYNSAEHYYSSSHLSIETQADKVVTEDAGSGYEFYNGLCRRKGLVCETAAGIIARFSEDEGLKELEAEQVLEEFGICKNPSWVMMKGCGRFCVMRQRLKATAKERMIRGDFYDLAIAY